MTAPDWTVNISIAGVAAIVNVAIVLITNSIYIGSRKNRWDESVERSMRNEEDIRRIRENWSALTGKTINGQDYRRR